MASTRIVALYGNDTTGADMSTYETSNYGTRIWRKGRTAPRRRAARPDATMIFAAPRRRRFPAVLAVAALGIALVVALGAPAIASLGRLLGAGAVGVTTGAGADGAASTPVSDWRRGEVPFLYQTDPTWANEPYAGGTIRENGCGPTCLAMVYVDLTGKTDHGPAEMAALSERSGYTVDGMTAWAFMTEGAAELGLSSSEVPADADRLRAELEAGDPVIASVRPGDFTTTGHFIVLAGVNKNGELIVHDPNSPERSAQTWDIERVLNQCNNLWAFSA